MGCLVMGICDGEAAESLGILAVGVDEGMEVLEGSRAGKFPTRKSAGNEWKSAVAMRLTCRPSLVSIPQQPPCPRRLHGVPTEGRTCHVSSSKSCVRPEWSTRLCQRRYCSPTVSRLPCIDWLRRCYGTGQADIASCRGSVVSGALGVSGRAPRPCRPSAGFEAHFDGWTVT